MGQHTVLVKPTEAANSVMQVSSVLLNNSRKKLKEAHLKNQDVGLREQNRNSEGEEAECSES
jgi:hypothetical protein